MSFKQRALPLIERGFKVFPVFGYTPFGCGCKNRECKAIAKHPVVKDWQKLATLDPAQIEEWDRQLPQSNVGILTGGTLLVIDIDDISSDFAQEIMPKLPATLCARSGRDGGLHQYYRMPEDYLSIGQMGGVDFRGKGGYIVGPGSFHKSGRLYEWVDSDAEIATLSGDVLNMFTQRTKKTKTITVGEQVPSGSRHDFLCREIFKRVVVEQKDRGEVKAVVEKYLLNQVEDGHDIPEAEIDAMISGAFQKKNTYACGDLSEAGVSEKFVEYWKDNLIRLDTGEWYQQDNGLWRKCHKPEFLFKPVRQIVYEVNKERAGEDENKKKTINQWFGRSGSYRFAEAVVKFSETPLLKKVDDFVIPEDTLPFQDGLYNMVTGEFRRFRPSDNITETMKCRFNPEATCPNWDSTVRYVTGGDPQILRYLQQVFGYIISSRTMRGIFFFIGPKWTGKTTLVTAIYKIMGEAYAGGAQLGLIHHTRGWAEDEDMARINAALVGKRFVYMDETKKDAIIDPAKFKRIASRDALLTARRMRENAFTFINKAKVIVMANQEPKIDVEDDAAWSRVVYVPFLIQFPENQHIEGFNETLVAEGSGIMNWCIKGFQDYLEHGFVKPDRVKEQVQNWQMEDSPLAQFLDEMCVVDETVRTTGKDLYEAYQNWLDTSEFDRETGGFKSASLFGKSLARMLGNKIETKSSNGKKFLKGVTLKRGR